MNRSAQLPLDFCEQDPSPSQPIDQQPAASRFTDPSHVVGAVERRQPSDRKLIIGAAEADREREAHHAGAVEQNCHQELYGRAYMP